MRIAIVDYGMGNIKSIVSALSYLRFEEVVLTDQYAALQTADKLILPGVGSFYKAMDVIRKKKLDTILSEIVVQNKKPILGICLGMQLLCKSSVEDQASSGLGFVDARVVKFNANIAKVPHVGFNQVKTNNDLKLYSGHDSNCDFYFTHSYKVLTDSDINACYCDYEHQFVASFEVNHVAGVQYHPELSQTNGLRLLKNFMDNF